MVGWVTPPAAKSALSGPGWPRLTRQLRLFGPATVRTTHPHELHPLPPILARIMDTAVQSPPAAAQTPPNQTPSQQPQAKRRRTSGQPSSRGVANLTPEQLARKRQNDREAQRAIRERTKQQIERLNNRIRELESQQPYHELQMALRAKEAVQAENDDIRRRLSSVMSLIQPILGTHGLNGTSKPSPLVVRVLFANICPL